MDIIELLDCLSTQIESAYETLDFVQKDKLCDEHIKKVLTNQIGMLVFCCKEIEEIKILTQINVKTIYDKIS